jgi:hypothetical protein
MLFAQWWPDILNIGAAYDIVHCWGFLDQFWIPNCTRFATEDAVRIGNSFITIPITSHYNRSQLSTTLLRVHVRNYSHLFHSCTYTQVANTTL